MKNISLVKIIVNDSYIPRYFIAILIFIILALGIYFTGFTISRYGSNFVGKGLSKECLVWILASFITLIIIVIRIIKIVKLLVYGTCCDGNICKMELVNIFIGWEIEFSYSYMNNYYYHKTRLFINKRTQKFNVGDKIEVLINPNDPTECIVIEFYKKSKSLQKV
ncbi:MAG: hypothetical protein LBI28_08615 [Treponema sp.]|jgi:hypothetical protein|nr:hypothetical protein [Treponema sp.]